MARLAKLVEQKKDKMLDWCDEALLVNELSLRTLEKYLLPEQCRGTLLYTVCY